MKSARLPLVRLLVLAASILLVACDLQPSSTALPVSANETLHGQSRLIASTQYSDECQQAAALLNTCAYETNCGAEMTMFLPSAARGQYVALIDDGSLSEEAFDRYCISACQTHSGRVDMARFAREACNAKVGTPPAPEATLEPSAHESGGMVWALGNLMLPTSGIPLSEVISELGKPVGVADSPYTCDSAFDTEDTKLYVYPHVELETDGRTAVARMVKVMPETDVLLGTTELSRLTEAGFKKAMGPRANPMGSHHYRAYLAPEGDDESAFDFLFVDDGRLDSVRFWIGC